MPRNTDRENPPNANLPRLPPPQLRISIPGAPRRREPYIMPRALTLGVGPILKNLKPSSLRRTNAAIPTTTSGTNKTARTIPWTKKGGKTRKARTTRRR